MDTHRSQSNFNLSNIIFRNKSSIFLEEKKFCIDPVLKQSYENYEKMQNDKYKKIQIKKMEKNIKEDEQKERTKSMTYKHFLNNKKKIRKYLNDLKVSFKNANISSKCNSNSVSRNGIILNYNNGKDIIKINKATSCKKDTILGYVNKDKNGNLTQNELHKIINHPYFTPLVLKKKEQYLILDGDNILKEDDSQVKKVEKSNNKEPFDRLGYFFKFINKINILNN